MRIDPQPGSLSRRQFMRLALAGTLTALVEAACQGAASPPPVTPVTLSTPKAIATPTTIPSPTPKPTATPAPSPTLEAVVTFPPLSQDTPELLRNRNDPNYNVRYVNPFPPVDHDAWRLEVGGMVETPGSFSLADLLAWPQVEQTSRLKCVECWSYKARWGGFNYATLAARVAPQPDATHVRFDCADGYYEVASLEELADPRVIFVLSMNDDLLLDEYGAPLRLMFPAKYGYKSAKAVVSMTFSGQAGRGFWSTVGPYTVDGDIQPGWDHPQDLAGEGKEIVGGEITAY